MTYLIVLLALLNFPNTTQKLHAHSRVTPSIASEARHGGMGVKLTAQTSGSTVTTCKLGTEDCLPFMVADDDIQRPAPNEIPKPHGWSEWRCAGCATVDTVRDDCERNDGGRRAQAYSQAQHDWCEANKPKPHRWQSVISNYQKWELEACLEHGETRVREWK